VKFPSSKDIQQAYQDLKFKSVVSKTTINKNESTYNTEDLSNESIYSESVNLQENFEKLLSFKFPDVTTGTPNNLLICLDEQLPENQRIYFYKKAIKYILERVDSSTLSRKNKTCYRII